MDRVCGLRPRLRMPQCRGQVRLMGPTLLLKASFLLSPDLWPLPSTAQAAESPPVFLSQLSALGTPPEAQLSSQALPQQGLASSAPPILPPYTHIHGPASGSNYPLPRQDEGQSAPQGRWRQTAPNGQPREGARAKNGKGGVCGGPLRLLPICSG